MGALRAGEHGHGRVAGDCGVPDGDTSRTAEGEADRAGWERVDAEGDEGGGSGGVCFEVVVGGGKGCGRGEGEVGVRVPLGNTSWLWCNVSALFVKGFINQRGSHVDCLPVYMTTCTWAWA